MSECGIHFAQEYVLVKQEQRIRINFCASGLREILFQETSTTLQTHEGRSHWKLEQVPNLDKIVFINFGTTFKLATNILSFLLPLSNVTFL